MLYPIYIQEHGVWGASKKFHISVNFFAFLRRFIVYSDVSWPNLLSRRREEKGREEKIVDSIIYEYMYVLKKNF